MSQPEPRNPFYLFLLLASLLFVITALAYVFIPILEQQAVQAGNPPPPSPLRDALRRDVSSLRLSPLPPWSEDLPIGFTKALWS